MSKSYGLLRAGFPYLTTLGMRRVTTNCMDLAFGDDRRLFVLCRTDGAGGEIRRINWEDQDLDVIGSGFVWPVQIIRDANEIFYVSDEGNHTISMWDCDGDSKGKWGEEGSEDGQLNRPSGIVFDNDGNLVVADTMNHRIQTFTPDGKFIKKFGTFGSSEGQLNMPWGVAVDDEGTIIVSDWRNDRIQRFTANGEYIDSFGNRASEGFEEGLLNRPAGVTVDHHGDIYVADRGNHRIVQYDKNGRYVDRFIGDSVLSKSGRTYVMSNAKALTVREMAPLEPTKRLRGPASVRFEGNGENSLMYIPDFGSHRVQIYKKEAYELSSDEIWEKPKSPFLFTV